MIIGIDASRINIKHASGVEKYSLAIIQALIKTNAAAKRHEFRLYTPKEIPGFARQIQRVIPFSRFWTIFRLSLEMLMRPPDVLFVPSHVLPFFAPKKSYITIHDIAFKKRPELYSFFLRFYLDFSTKRALKLCTKIFVPSRSVMEDIKIQYGYPEEKIIVLHHGAPERDKIEIRDADASSAVFIYLGRLERKKNVLCLLEAWAIVQKNELFAKNKAKLLLIGANGYGAEEIIERANMPDLRESLEIKGYLPEPELKKIMRFASAMIFPSFEEGFGLPILEAFQSECPVICSDIPIFREVAGQAALFADPLRPEDFAKHILKFLPTQEKTQQNIRAELRKKGLERLKLFSWESTSEKLLKVLESN